MFSDKAPYSEGIDGSYWKIDSLTTFAKRQAAKASGEIGPASVSAIPSRDGTTHLLKRVSQQAFMVNRQGASGVLDESLMISVRNAIFRWRTHVLAFWHASEHQTKTFKRPITTSH